MSADLIEGLRRLQTEGVPPNAYRLRWIKELAENAKILDQVTEDPEGMRGVTIMATSAILYLAHRLAEELIPGEGEVERCERRYAEVELGSYPGSQEDLDDTLEWCRRVGVVADVYGVQMPDNSIRYRITSALDQGTRAGTVLRRQLIHSVARFPPPVVKITVDYD